MKKLTEVCQGYVDSGSNGRNCSWLLLVDGEENGSEWAGMVEWEIRVR